MTEIWRDIKNWKGSYQISSFGRIKSLARTVPFRNGVTNIYEKIMRPSLSASGYLVTLFSKGGRNALAFNQSVHRLVAVAFIPNPNRYSDVNHKNGIRHDNRMENLEWCNRRENVSHGFNRVKKSSKYIGVREKLGKWEASIWFNKKINYLGRFTTEKQASIAYKNALKKYQLTNKYC